jgi:hypothetical protein
MGIFEHLLDISKYAYWYVESIGVSFKTCINCVVFFMLNVYGRGVNWSNFCVNSFANLYARSFRQFTLRRLVGYVCVFL